MKLYVRSYDRLIVKETGMDEFFWFCQQNRALPLFVRDTAEFDEIHGHALISGIELNNVYIRVDPEMRHPTLSEYEFFTWDPGVY